MQISANALISNLVALAAGKIEGLLLFGQSQSIDIGDSDPDKIAGLYQICVGLVTRAEADLDEATTRWHGWFYTYLMWHESARLTTRIQAGGGPGRGLMQFEATTAWDTIKQYVLGPTAGLVARLAAGAGLDTAATMTAALRAFADNGNPANVWPPAPFDQVEQWLITSDSFAVTLMQIQFERFTTALPPVAPTPTSANPRDPTYHPQFADVWADSWWKGVPGDRPARIASFLAHALAFDDALPLAIRPEE